MSLTSRTKAETLWADPINQRILIHAYMLKLFGQDPSLLHDRISISGDDPERHKLAALLELMKRKSSLLDESDSLIDDKSLKKDNPYDVIEALIQKELGDLDQLTLKSLKSSTEISFRRFYELGFNPDRIMRHQFRELVLENLLSIFNLSLNAIELLPRRNDFPEDESFLLHIGDLNILLTISSNIESKSGSILATHRLARKSDATPVVIALSYSEDAIEDATRDTDRDSGSRPVYLIDLLSYLKLTVEMAKFSEQGLTERATLGLNKLFAGQGGIIVISDWAESIRGDT